MALINLKKSLEKARKLISGDAKLIYVEKNQIVTVQKQKEYHGKTNTPEYKTWVGMKHRCINPNSTSYENYGGRGIKVCDRWINSFTLFLQDLGTKPDGMSLERIGNSGNYEPSNCCWATKTEQNYNRRQSRPSITGYKGVSYYKGKHKYGAYINYNHKLIHLGLFRNKEDAILARKQAEVQYGISY
jgi:hypothetical protein